MHYHPEYFLSLCFGLFRFHNIHVGRGSSSTYINKRKETTSFNCWTNKSWPENSRETANTENFIVVQIEGGTISIQHNDLYSLVSKSLWCLDFPTRQTELFAQTEEFSFQAIFYICIRALFSPNFGTFSNVDKQLIFMSLSRYLLS